MKEAEGTWRRGREQGKSSIQEDKRRQEFSQGDVSNATCHHKLKLKPREESRNRRDKLDVFGAFCPQKSDGEGEPRGAGGMKVRNIS